MSEPNKVRVDNTKIEGEGDYEAAEVYNKATREFVEAGKVDEAATAAKETSPEEQEELEAAEQAGKDRAKEEDPQLVRDYQKPE